MTRQKITDVVIEFMKKENMSLLGSSDFGLLNEIWEECFKRGIVKEVYDNHPVNKFFVVLNAIERDKKRFNKGFMLCCGGRENREARVRIFKLNSEKADG